MKALYGLWADVKVADLNRILKPHGVRLVMKKSKEWGKNVNVTAHALGAPKKRSREAPVAPGVDRTEPVVSGTMLSPGA